MVDRQHLGAFRAQMSNVCSMFALAMVMFDRSEEPDILRLAVSSVGALGPYHAQGSYLVDGGVMHSSDGDDRVIAELIELGGADGLVEVPGAGWSWAFPMRAVGGHTGYLVVSADHEPSVDQRFLLTTLAQLTGAALVGAGLHRRERTITVELGELNARLEATNEQLEGVVTDLQQRQRIHEVLTRVAAYGGGAAGIADAVHDLTALAVVAEDRFGNLLAWAGPGRPRTYPRPQPRTRAELLTRVRRSGRAMRYRDRIVAVAQPRDEVLGVLSVVDPRHQAGERDVSRWSTARSCWPWNWPTSARWPRPSCGCAATSSTTCSTEPTTRALGRGRRPSDMTCTNRTRWWSGGGTPRWMTRTWSPHWAEPRPVDRKSVV